MRENSYGVMALSIADNPHPFHVVAVNGHDRLNTPFCFDIDLVSTEGDLACSSLLQRSAYLQMGGSADNLHGVHGRIHALKQVHQGQTLSLYRLQLMPALQQLDGAPRRRAFNGMNVPEIIHLLLKDVETTDNSVRFDQRVGLYPAREHCIQHDETDLHFLSRLCEEEGISFRFEHAPGHHTLVFSDDPLDFPEWPVKASVEHLAQRLSAKNCDSTHTGEHYMPAAPAPATSPLAADNQVFPAVRGPDTSVNRQRQLSRRLLERLRCERCDTTGRSVQPWMRSGQVMRVEDHPEARLNDQWLLTEVSHNAWQLEPLRRCTALEVMHIIQAMVSITRLTSGLTALLAPHAGSTKPPLAYYENSFQVIPWAMPFRPAPAHPKPALGDVQYATQMAEQPDRTGRVLIRYDWQTDTTSPGSYARIASSVAPQPAGTRLAVRFIAGDADQPLICGLAPDHTVHVDPRPRAEHALHMESLKPLTLKGPRATLHISQDGVQCTPSNAERAVNDV